MKRSPLLLTFLLLSGCADTDPYQRTGQWQPGGINALNLAAMVANPRDLVRGRGMVGTPAIEVGPAVTRYWTGRAVQLPTSNSQGTGAGQGRAAAAGGDTTGGAN